MGMIGYAESGGEMARLFRLLAATVGMLAIFPISAESADDLKPPVGYRRWFHVNTMIVDKSSSLFEVLGGMHNVHVNSVGESALRKGGPYPNGTVFLTDLHECSVIDGSYVFRDRGPAGGVRFPTSRVGRRDYRGRHSEKSSESDPNLINRLASISEWRDDRRAPRGQSD